MRITRHITAGGIAASIIAGPVWADVTPREVWDDWTAQMEELGLVVNATEAEAGGDLTLRDVRIETKDEEAETAVTMTMPEVALSDAGNGAVTIGLPARFPISMQMVGDETVSLDLIYETVGLEMTVSGDASEMTTSYSAQSSIVTIDKLVSDGEAVPLDAARFEIEDMSGSTVSGSAGTEDGARRTVQSVTSGPMRYALDMSDPEDPARRFVLSGETASLKIRANQSVPAGAQMDAMLAAWAAGLRADQVLTFGPGSTDFELAEEGGKTTVSTTSEGGSLSARVEDEAMRYEGEIKDVTLSATGASLPAPLDLTMQSVSFEQQVRDAGDADAQDAARRLRGSGNLAMVGVGVPGGGAGRPTAEMTAEGEVSFSALAADDGDGDDVEGTPPVGEASVQLSGLSGLLPQLPQDYQMGAMMLNFFMEPGDAADTLETRIELLEDGGIVVNGSRVN